MLAEEWWVDYWSLLLLLEEGIGRVRREGRCCARRGRGVLL